MIKTWGDQNQIFPPANPSQILAENENVLSWEKDCWIKIDCGLFWFLEQISLKALIEFSQINAALPWLIKLTSVAVCPLVNSSPLTKHTFSCGGVLFNTPIINKKLANEWHTYLQSLALEWKPPFLFLFSLCLQALRASTWRLFFWLRPDWARAYTISAAVDTIMQKLPSIYSSHFIAMVTKFKNNPRSSYCVYWFHWLGKIWRQNLSKQQFYCQFMERRRFFLRAPKADSQHCNSTLFFCSTRVLLHWESQSL